MVLRELGGPMSATDLWTAINDLHVLGRPIKRTSLVSALDAKYHEKQMFTKPEPGVYALMNGNGR
jgi:hypothetical protein